MRLVDGDGPVVPDRFPPLVHPAGIAPLLPPEFSHDGRGGRRVLGPEAHRIGLERQHGAIDAPQCELVTVAFGDAGQKDLPHPG